MDALAKKKKQGLKPKTTGLGLGKGKGKGGQGLNNSNNTTTTVSNVKGNGKNDSSSAGSTSTVRRIIKDSSEDDDDDQQYQRKEENNNDHVVDDWRGAGGKGVGKAPTYPNLFNALSRPPPVRKAAKNASYTTSIYLNSSPSAPSSSSAAALNKKKKALAKAATKAAGTPKKISKVTLKKAGNKKNGTGKGRGKDLLWEDEQQAYHRDQQKLDDEDEDGYGYDDNHLIQELVRDGVVAPSSSSAARRRSISPARSITAHLFSSSSSNMSSSSSSASSASSSGEDEPFQANDMEEDESELSALSSTLEYSLTEDDEDEEAQGNFMKKNNMKRKSPTKNQKKRKISSSAWDMEEDEAEILSMSSSTEDDLDNIHNHAYDGVSNTRENDGDDEAGDVTFKLARTVSKSAAVTKKRKGDALASTSALKKGNKKSEVVVAAPFLSLSPGGRKAKTAALNSIAKIQNPLSASLDEFIAGHDSLPLAKDDDASSTTSSSVYEEPESTQDYSDQEIMVEIVRDKLLNGWESNSDDEASLDGLEGEDFFSEIEEEDVEKEETQAIKKETERGIREGRVQVVDPVHVLPSSSKPGALVKQENTAIFPFTNYLFPSQGRPVGFETKTSLPGPTGEVKTKKRKVDEVTGLPIKLSSSKKKKKKAAKKAAAAALKASKAAAAAAIASSPAMGMSNFSPFAMPNFSQPPFLFSSPLPLPLNTNTLNSTTPNNLLKTSTPASAPNPWLALANAMKMNGGTTSSSLPFKSSLPPLTPSVPLKEKLLASGAGPLTPIASSANPLLSKPTPSASSLLLSNPAAMKAFADLKKRGDMSKILESVAMHAKIKAAAQAAVAAGLGGSAPLPTPSLPLPLPVTSASNLLPLNNLGVASSPAPPTFLGGSSSNFNSGLMGQTDFSGMSDPFVLGNTNSSAVEELGRMIMQLPNQNSFSMNPFPNLDMSHLDMSSSSLAGFNFDFQPPTDNTFSVNSTISVKQQPLPNSEFFATPAVKEEIEENLVKKEDEEDEEDEEEEEEEEEGEEEVVEEEEPQAEEEEEDADDDEEENGRVDEKEAIKDKEQDTSILFEDIFLHFGEDDDEEEKERENRGKVTSPTESDSNNYFSSSNQDSKIARTSSSSSMTVIDDFSRFDRIPIGTFWNSQRSKSKVAKRRDVQRAIKKSSGGGMLERTLFEKSGGGAQHHHHDRKGGQRGGLSSSSSSLAAKTGLHNSLLFSPVLNPTIMPKHDSSIPPSQSLEFLESIPPPFFL